MQTHRMHKSQGGFTAVAAFIGILIAVLLIGVTGSLVYKVRQHSGSRILMIVTSSGGLCATECHHPVYTLYDSGKFTGGGYTDLNGSETTKLKKLIADTDLLKYGPNPHPQCQSFMDGSDQVLMFPQKYGDKTFTTCMLDIPASDPAFTYIDGLLETHYAHAD